MLFSNSTFFEFFPHFTAEHFQIVSFIQFFQVSIHVFHGWVTFRNYGKNNKGHLKSFITMDITEMKAPLT